MDLQEVLRKHSLFLEGKEGGERANLIDADLRGANLEGAISSGIKINNKK